MSAVKQSITNFKLWPKAAAFSFAHNRKKDSAMCAVAEMVAEIL